MEYSYDDVTSRCCEKLRRKCDADAALLEDCDLKLGNASGIIMTILRAEMENSMISIYALTSISGDNGEKRIYIHVEKKRAKENNNATMIKNSHQAKESDSLLAPELSSIRSSKYYSPYSK